MQALINLLLAFILSIAGAALFMLLASYICKKYFPDTYDKMCKGCHLEEKDKE